LEGVVPLEPAMELQRLLWGSRIRAAPGAAGRASWPARAGFDSMIGIDGVLLLLGVEIVLVTCHGLHHLLPPVFAFHRGHGADGLEEFRFRAGCAGGAEQSVDQGFDRGLLSRSVRGEVA